MKRTAFFILGLLAICGIAASAQNLRVRESLSMQSRVLNQEVRFSVYLPVNYFESDVDYPVIYLLHGLGDDETSWLEYGRIGQYADLSVNSGESVPMIFVMPQGFRTYYVNDYKGSFLYQDMFVKELVPYIDSLFRTIPEKQSRATLGYSMGGFGAIMLHLKHPDVFGTSIPLSMSVRTDEQYMTEEASGWDEQWGRIFGAPGLTGADRITEYYKNNSPYHVLPSLSKNELKKLNIYMVNGDEEQTLCRSNEELHILMHRLGIPHEYRVIDGGHSFKVWWAALPNSLRFISDAFEGKNYRGDLKNDVQSAGVNDAQMLRANINGDNIYAFTPEDYLVSDRKYPAIYFTGNFDSIQKATISAMVNSEIKANRICAMLLIFLPEMSSEKIQTIIPLLEDEFRIRKGYRFRSIAGSEKSALQALELLVSDLQFSSCYLSDAKISVEEVPVFMAEEHREKLKRTTIFIDAADKSDFSESSGTMHMIMRDMEITHEYRLREGNGGFEWMMEGLKEALGVISTRFHR
ncbi:MAG: Enterochelin [Bacteroidetes bacterium]|nr:MAG: Enterochelin [Bacteroidota bacterium]